MDGFKPDLVNLPWETLLTLASGYAGYFVANVGIRDHHKAIDTVFSTLVFGFISAFVYKICTIALDLSLVSASPIAFVATMFAGGIWSFAGRKLLETILRVSKVSHANDLPSAWVALFGIGIPATQLTVKLKDGSWLMCDDLSKFEKHPNGPCTLGAKGDVLMYVTHAQSEIGIAFFPTPASTHEVWGDEVTYIPADQIVRIDLRRKA